MADRRVRLEKYKMERFQRTLDFLKSFADKTDKILDLGPPNDLSALMTAEGFDVTNTPTGKDLDFDYDIVKDERYTLITAFEIFEHMVSPFPLLRSIKAEKLIASVPLNLWFAKAYWNKNDPFDRHYHEFEDRQFDMLLEKSGWEIMKSEKWTGKTGELGLRPILRQFTPRFYIVFCRRKARKS